MKRGEEKQRLRLWVSLVASIYATMHMPVGSYYVAVYLGQVSHAVHDSFVL